MDDERNGGKTDDDSGVTAPPGALLTVRVHRRDIVNACAKVEIVAFAAPKCAEDPAHDFVLATAIRALVSSGASISGNRDQ